MSISWGEWRGPTTGAVAQSHKTVYFIASDLKNGGVSAVVEGLQAASRSLKWSLKVLDGEGNANLVKTHFIEALRAKADGIVLGGVEASQYSDEIAAAHKKNLKLIGWHASPQPGSSKNLIANITTDPALVAKMAAELVPDRGSKKAGVVIITDRNFSIAAAKVSYMKTIVEKVKAQKVLSIEYVDISKADQVIPLLVEDLNRRFGKRWTHTLAINDIYFDHMNYPLKKIKRTDVVNIAAGDGSRIAINRIKSGLSQQIATIAEPLHCQGWQIADELNRAFHGDPQSGFVNEPIVVTKAFLDSLKSNDVEANISFQDAYMKIWYP
ncbi:substrate-binding domain-containing protein [Bdellovibrio svalbardensis]|uniref:Substrate-binding domain-containing protein n=1 Tax=Bdellovibrio svalbardensis TaxID=2972972 RepID=A0ABT6DIG5_9BACT|nr:substrate-binding domain-containing protein [Bdellovibrio svalbardensis]MDG0816035.1 substrate-binding domain-containing protein [Bdellovibrio svalbardensis]